MEVSPSWGWSTFTCVLVPQKLLGNSLFIPEHICGVLGTSEQFVGGLKVKILCKAKFENVFI